MLGQGREAEVKEEIKTHVKKGMSWIKDALKF
jgi:hypothetical protein